MSTTVNMSRGTVTIESDWHLARERAIQGFAESLDPAIRGWFAIQRLNVAVLADWVETEVDGVDIHYIFDISLVFDDPEKALLFQRTFCEEV